MLDARVTRKFKRNGTMALRKCNFFHIILYVFHLRKFRKRVYISLNLLVIYFRFRSLPISHVSLFLLLSIPFLSHDFIYCFSEKLKTKLEGIIWKEEQKCQAELNKTVKLSNLRWEGLHPQKPICFKSYNMTFVQF